MTPWKQVTIIGAGLIGGSLGLALKRAGLARTVIGVGHRQASLDEAAARGAADRTTLSIAEGVRGSDLVVLATPVGLFRAAIERAAPSLEPGAVVIDVGSTKSDVVAAIETLMPPGRAFVGCHPIAGSEQRGVSHARADLFDGATCVVTPTPRTCPDALARVVALWQALGMVVRQTSPAAHDRLLAQVSHLPHVAAAALVGVMAEEAETLIGPGWAGTTRVASGDAALWRDILLSNAAEVAAALSAYEGYLARFREALLAGDGPAVERLLVECKTRRDRLIHNNNNRCRHVRDVGAAPPRPDSPCCKEDPI
jgi:prephenate dehydrogenase